MSQKKQNIYTDDGTIESFRVLQGDSNDLILQNGLSITVNATSGGRFISNTSGVFSEQSSSSVLMRQNDTPTNRVEANTTNLTLEHGTNISLQANTLNVTGEVTLPDYPSARSDTTTPSNYLATSFSGNLLSIPISQFLSSSFDSQKDEVTIPNGVDTLNVVLPTQYVATDYIVAGGVHNATDVSPNILSYNIVAKTRDDFTVKLSQATNTANYTFRYVTLRRSNLDYLEYAKNLNAIGVYDADGSPTDGSQMTDFSGNGNHIPLTNVTYESTSGFNGGPAWRFNGTNARGQVPNGIDDLFESKYTILILVKPFSLSGTTAHLFSLRRSLVQGDYSRIEITGDDIAYVTADDFGSSVTLTDTLTTNFSAFVAYHGTVGTEAGMYYGNTKVTTTSRGPWGSVATFYIGAKANNSQYFNGWIQRVILFDYRLPNYQIENLINLMGI